MVEIAYSNCRSIRDMSLRLEQPSRIVFGPTAGNPNGYLGGYLMHSAQSAGAILPGAGKRGRHFEGVLGGQTHSDQLRRMRFPGGGNQACWSLKLRSGSRKSCPTPHGFGSIR